VMGASWMRQGQDALILLRFCSGRQWDSILKFLDATGAGLVAASSSATSSPTGPSLEYRTG